MKNLLIDDDAYSDYLPAVSQQKDRRAECIAHARLGELHNAQEK
jgi:hypothetical protein